MSGKQQHQQRRVRFAAAGALPPCLLATPAAWHCTGGPLASRQGSHTSSAGARAAPFAAMLPWQAHQQPRAAPLFSLAQATSSSGGSGGSSEEATSSSGIGSGMESDVSSDLHLDRINCQLCRKPLAQPGRSRRPWSRAARRSSAAAASEFLVCDCCCRAFHESCCHKAGISTAEHKGAWFESDACRQAHAGLRAQVKRGRTELPGGRSWQLIDCAPVSRAAPGGLQRLAALKAALSDVLDVMLPLWGPGAGQQLVDTTKGYAVLLRQGSLPVSAALLDVYGRELAVLDLASTRLEHQGRGHCRALLGAIEGFLGPQLGVAKLMAVCPAEEPDTVRAWRAKFGFRQPSGRELKALQAAIPPLSFYEDSVLLTKGLAKLDTRAKPAPPRPQAPRPQEPQPAAAS